MTDCIICGRVLPYDGSPCSCKTTREEDWLDVKRNQMYLASEGEWNNGDYYFLRRTVEKEEERRREIDERGDW